ncbi:unnamed protein product [Brassica rapa subsp. trilocularis]|uniref:(rape) hypothetical protein n=1 Tax=Brassica napus TaxID=3708 RepID=A0A817ADD0_BRANA|nr:unnamed protein product [Brassica napus]
MDACEGNDGKRTAQQAAQDVKVHSCRSWHQRVSIVAGAARGLEYLHEKANPHIVHRDIKSSNILIFGDGVAKIAEFDLSNESDMAARLHSSRILGTFSYHAPDEYAMTGQLSAKSDVYSFGVVLLELLTGRKPVDHTLPRGKQSLVTWCVDSGLGGDYPPEAVAKFAVVAALCVQYEDSFRPNMRTVVNAFQSFVESATATAAATPTKRTNYLFTPHAKAVAGICTVIQTNTSLCCKTLKHVPTNDPIELIRALAVAAESSVKNSVAFLSEIKPKHTSNATAAAAISSCEKNLKYALEDFTEFWKATGKDVKTLAHNYFTCKKTLMSIMGYHWTCLDDIEDKSLLKEMEIGIGVGKNLSSDSYDVFNGLNTIFKTFGIKVKLNEEDTSPRPPPLSAYYY